MTPVQSKKGEAFRILLIEDDRHDAELTQTILKAYLSCDVTWAATRAEFQTALEKFKPNAIFSDSGLPTLDAFTAMEIAGQKCPCVPFIFCTGNNNPAIKSRALAGGAFDYISKNDSLALISLLKRLSNLE